MDWALADINGYWDQRVQAIERLSRELKQVPAKAAPLSRASSAPPWAGGSERSPIRN